MWRTLELKQLLLMSLKFGLAPPPSLCFLYSNLSSLCVAGWGFADSSQQMGGMWNKFQGPKMLVLHKLIVVSWLYGLMCQYLVHVFFHLFLPGVLLSRLTYIEKESTRSKKVHEVKKFVTSWYHQWCSFIGRFLAYNFYSWRTIIHVVFGGPLFKLPLSYHTNKDIGIKIRAFFFI
jgi:hypothetical protein